MFWNIAIIYILFCIMLVFIFFCNLSYLILVCLPCCVYCKFRFWLLISNCIFTLKIYPLIIFIILNGLFLFGQIYSQIFFLYFEFIRSINTQLSIFYIYVLTQLSIFYIYVHIPFFIFYFYYFWIATSKEHWWKRKKRTLGVILSKTWFLMCLIYIYFLSCHYIILILTIHFFIKLKIT